MADDFVATGSLLKLLMDYAGIPADPASSFLPDGGDPDYSGFGYGDLVPAGYNLTQGVAYIDILEKTREIASAQVAASGSTPATFTVESTKAEAAVVIASLRQSPKDTDNRITINGELHTNGTEYFGIEFFGQGDIIQQFKILPVQARVDEKTWTVWGAQTTNYSLEHNSTEISRTRLLETETNGVLFGFCDLVAGTNTFDLLVSDPNSLSNLISSSITVLGITQF